VPLEQLAAVMQKKVDVVVRESTFAIFNAIVLQSPVDTGRFRANWNISANVPKTHYDESRTSNSALQMSLQWVQRSSPVGGVVYIANGLPYAAVLEYGGYPNPPKYGSKKRGEAGPAIHVTNGYSMQAPYGMVRISVLRFRRFVLDAIERGRQQG